MAELIILASLAVVAIGFVLGIIFVGASAIVGLLWFGAQLAVCIIPVILGIALFYLIFLY